MPDNLLQILKHIVDTAFSHAAFSGLPGGAWMSGPLITVAPVFAAYIVLFFASLIWVYIDAKKRGKNGFIVMLFILITGWPLSYIWWFFLRPPLKAVEPAPAYPAGNTVRA